MKRVILFCLFIFSSWFSLVAQLPTPISDGKTQLENKRIELKNKFFKVSPVIDYSAQAPDKLKIVISLELFDNKGNKVENKNDWLFLINDLKGLISFFKEKGYLVDRIPKIESLIENSTSIEVYQDGNKVKVGAFDSGFNGFRRESAPIIADVQNIPGSVITLKFNFVHIASTEKKKKLSVPQFREWKFRLPGSAVADNTPHVDCNELKNTYSQKLQQIVKDKDITYFESQLSFQNIDADRLKKELEEFKINISKVEQFRKVIGFNQDLKKCPDARAQLLAKIDQYLQQKDEIADIEKKIARSQVDLCANFEKRYKPRLNKLKAGKNLAYFQNKSKDPKTDLLTFETNFQSFTKKQRNLQMLKSKIVNDPNSAKCKEIKNKLIQQIKTAQVSEKEIETIENWIRSKKEELAKNKELFYESYYKKYNADLKSFVSKFDVYTKELAMREAELSERYGENNNRIATLYKINSFSPKSIDSLEMAKELLAICTEDNMQNLDEVDSIIHYLTQFEADAELLSQECESQFTQKDRKQGLIKAKPLLKGFKSLTSEIRKKNDEIERLHDRILKNNQKIGELNSIFNPAQLINNQQLINKYDSLFARNLRNLKQVVVEFEELSEDFKEKQYGKFYFSWVKKKLYKRSKNIENKLNSYRNKQDTLLVSKSIDFKKNNVNVYIDDIYNFNQTEANLRPRVEYLINEIDDSVSRKFPYFYLIAGVIVLIILIFGAKVYINALRIKKQKEVKKKEYEAAPEKKITLSKPVENNVDKGKGLDEVRGKAGTDYLEIDLNYEWDDSAVRKVYFKRDCIIKTYRFFEDSLRLTDADKTAFETGGYLIGRWDYNPEDNSKYDVSLEEFIEPGDDAKFSNYQLNFGAKIGIKLQKALENIKQKTGEDYLMTAWFHSHPGLKIFLSDFDLSVQDGFSNGKETLKMIALVLDPYTNNWDTGIFTYTSDGSKMNNANESKRFFSLDNMYKWALKQPEVKHVNLENYFSVELQKFYSDTVCDQLYFDNVFILEMKRFLEDNSNSSEAIVPLKYLEGKLYQKNTDKSDIFLKKLTDSDNSGVLMDDRVLGILTIDHAFSVENMLSGIKNDELLVALIYDSREERIIIVPRNKEKIFNKPVLEAYVTLSELIEWTRKRK